MVVVGEDLLGARHVARRAFQFNAIRSQVDRDVQAVFEHVQILVARAKQGLDVRADFDALLHLVSWTNHVETAAGCPATQSPAIAER